MRNPPQEPDVVSGRRVAGVGIGVVVATVIGALVAYGIASCGGGYRPPRAQQPGEFNAIEMRPFTIEAQGIEMHEREEQHLTTYGWIDRERGIVHVPIERAFELVLGAQGDR